MSRKVFYYEGKNKIYLPDKSYIILSMSVTLKILLHLTKDLKLFRSYVRCADRPDIFRIIVTTEELPLGGQAFYSRFYYE